MATFILVVVLVLFFVLRVAISIANEKLQREKSKYQEKVAELEGKKAKQKEEEASKGYLGYSRNNYDYDIREYQSEIGNIEEKEKSLDWLKKASLVAFLVIFAIVTIFSSTYIIGEQNLAVVTTFGKAESVSGTGIHFKIPYIQKVKKLDATIQGFPIGYKEEDNEAQISDSLMITSDFNFVNVDFYVEYRIDDPITYLYGSSNPEGTLKNIAQAAIRNTIGRYSVDSVLTTGKSEIQAAIKEDVVKELETSKTGLTLINITIQDSEPPTEEVKKAFKEVETARQGSEEKLNEAEKYRNEKIPQAEAEADAIIRQAEAQKQERINEAIGEVALFNAMYTEYIKDPDVTKVRIYYEAMEELLPNLQIIVNGTDSEIKPIIVQDKNTVKATEEVN